MLRLIFARFGQLALVLFGISLLCFVAFELAPGDPAYVAMRALLNVDNPPAGAVAQLRAEMGLDAPLPVRYLRWLGRGMTGDLGYSFQTRRPVLQEIAAVLPATVMLAGVTLAFTVLLVVPSGVLAAAKPGSWIDRAILFVSLTAVTIPDFFLGVILILVFSLGLRWLPVAGSGGPLYLILPALTIAVGFAAITIRILRNSLLAALRQEYIRAARARGLPEPTVLAKHALRNSLIPLVTYLGSQFAYLFGGAMVVETLFRWPGLGRLLVESVLARDFMVVQGCVLVTATSYVLINLLVDLTYALIDPRARPGGQRVG